MSKSSFIKNRSVSCGFTLVELVLVMTIAGVLAAVMGPRMVDRTAFQTHGSAAEIRTALRYAQKLALAKNREVCVTTSATPDLTLNFSLTAGGACDQLVSRPGDGAASYVVAPADVAFTSSVPVFRFDGQGRPITSPPNVVLAVPVNFTVGGSVSMSVQAQTGYVQ